MKKLLLIMILWNGMAQADVIKINNVDYNHIQSKGIDLLLPVKSGHSLKIDFAYLERHYPISNAVLDKLKPEDLKTWDMESLDQLYARLSSGPIPNGFFSGEVMPTLNGGLKKFQQYVTKFAKLGEVDKWAGWLWGGKYFYRDERLLKNVIMQKDFAKLFGGNFNQAFPAKLFCGQSLLDSRRESIIIDYSQAESLPGLGGKIVGKNGFAIRDEIRMVRPGFYLGRAYANKVFLLYFTVNNDKFVDRKDDCWIGNQARN